MVEKIKWHKYPEEKPKAAVGQYLVSPCYGITATLLWFFGKWKPFYLGNFVNYWAEMPKGYRDAK